MKPPTGWFRLRSGTLYHGTLPPGVESLPAPVPGDTGVLIPPPGDARKDALIAFVDRHNLDGDGRSATPNRTKAELWTLIEEAVDASQSRGQVRADVLVEEGVADAEQVTDADPAGEEPVDVEIGHEAEG